MTVRAAVLSLSLAMISAAPTLAQGPTGSITLMSRPPGAWFRLEGDVVLVGRTPMTLSRGLTGRFRVSGSEIGYQRWKRSLVLDGMTADTVWITLREKSGLMAGARSLLLPGWGQFYDDHPLRGMVFMFSGIAVGAGLGVNEIRYRDHRDDVDAAKAAYLAAQTPAEVDAALAARQRADNSVGNDRQRRKVLLGVGAGIVGLSVIDAIAFVPRPVGTILLGAATGGSNSSSPGRLADGPRFALALARVKF